MLLRSSNNLMRDRDGPHDGKVATVELFFDLVFVFAITQLSHGLLHHFTPLGAVEMLVLLLAVWWVWMYSTWALNWLDPELLPVRLLLYGLMLAGLFISMSIPEAFGARGLSFGLAFAASQIGRSLFCAWAMAGWSPTRHLNFQRITCWMLVSGLFWIGGGLAPPHLRLPIWLLALGIEYAGPIAAFQVPGLGRSSTTDWDVHGEHIAERCGLFVIICLGETLLINGATFAEMEWTGIGMQAFMANFLGTVAMWWIYFHIGYERAAHTIEASEDPGQIARVAFTYAHIPIIAGIVLTAVAAELVIAHPGGHTGPGAAAAILGGPGLFLLGTLWFKKLTAGWAPLSHLVGLGLMLLLALVSSWFTPLGLTLSATAVLMLVAAWEHRSLGRGHA
ncbi:MAG: low temperature requirement protein A [Amaricoccus sp.]